MNDDYRQLSKALAIMTGAFEFKEDKGGFPYSLHCLAVMEGVRHLGPIAMTIAVLHDLLEDCPEWTVDRLREEGFSREVYNSVDQLTRIPGENYEDYIKSLSMNPVLRAIKMADLRHNMNPSRLKGLTKKDFDRMKKYQKAYVYLSSV